MSPATEPSEAVIYRVRSRNVPRPSVLIALIAFVMLGVEIGSRILVPRISRIEGRTAREHALLVQPPSVRPYVALLGNSLLDTAVQFDSLREALHDTIDIRRYVVEQTSYRDWQFGLRRLFDEGMRPNTVLLMLAPEHIMTDAIRGDYFANRMLRTRDVFELANVLHLNLTETSSMIFANLSSFYGVRADIRKVILGRLMPQVPLLTQRMVMAPPVVYSEARIRSETPDRLQALADTCAARGARFVFVLPPKPASVARSSVVAEEAVRAAGLSVLRPWTPSEFQAVDFPDGYHLRPESAPVFTRQLIDAIRTLQLPSHRQTR